MRHLLVSSFCVAVIGLAMIFAADKVATSNYNNVYAIVSKGSLSMVKINKNKAQVFAARTDK